ncbi:MAG: hypothetical protein U5L07_16855 [Desulfobacterales bacterium]|nr:hypothetical protein [Desulfobacterales bacterium]
MNFHPDNCECFFCTTTVHAGFISTRIAGTDGVSLETLKLANVLEKQGIKSFYFAGELETPSQRSYLCEKAHFKNPPPQPDEFASDVRKSFGIKDDEYFILQPTRVIKRKGIELAIELDGYVNTKAIEQAKRVLKDEMYGKHMVEHNYNVASRFYSYAVLEQKLSGVIQSVAPLPQLTCDNQPAKNPKQNAQ